MQRTQGPFLIVEGSRKENRILGSEVTSSLGGKAGCVEHGVLGKYSLVGKGETQRSSSHSFILLYLGGCLLGTRPVAVEGEVLRRGPAYLEGHARLRDQLGVGVGTGCLSFWLPCGAE